MSFELDYHPAVREELAESWKWYQEQRVGLGTEFLDEVESVLTAVRANPNRFGFADRQTGKVY